jgi:nucleotide-binding universal stress UspA family protein
MSMKTISCATHPRQGILRTLLGNVAEKVVRTARKPVLTIRAAEG